MQFSLVHHPKHYSACDQMKINQDESVFSGEERNLKQKNYTKDDFSEFLNMGRQ